MIIRYRNLIYVHHTKSNERRKLNEMYIDTLFDTGAYFYIFDTKSSTLWVNYPFPERIETKLTAFLGHLGALWKQCDQSTPRKAVDLGHVLFFVQKLHTKL